MTNKNWERKFGEANKQITTLIKDGDQEKAAKFIVAQMNGIREYLKSSRKKQASRGQP